MQLTARDVAAYLNVSEKTVYRMIQRGELPAYRVHDQFRFHRTELLEWALAHRINVSPRLFDDQESATSSTLSVSEAIDEGGIFYRLEGADKASALRAVVQVLRLPDDVDREMLLRVLLAREAMASTGIGEGIAIPHVRNPVVLQVPKPQITLCFLEKPIDFQALDGKPVFALFSLITPTVKTHLHLLSRLAFSLQDKRFKEALARQAPREEIVDELTRVESHLAVSQTPAAAEMSP